jgi:ribosomal protein L40E
VIVCGQCGARNPDEAFCSECGAYLDWEGERIQQAPPPQAETPPPEAEVPGFVERVRTAIGLGAGEGAAGPAEAAPAEVVPAAEHVLPPAPVPAIDPASAGAASLVVPVPAAAPVPPPVPRSSRHAAPTGQPIAAEAPAPVRPGVAAAKPPRRDVPIDDRRPAPGEVVCGACGAGNIPTRKFCRRCGTDLADAPVVKVSWWRRLFTRTPKVGPTAGFRPVHTTRRKLPSKTLLLGGLFAVLAVVAVVQRGPLRNAGDTVLDRVKGTQLVNPRSIEASGAAAGHPAEAARDGATNRFWAPAAAGNGRGEFVQANFDKPFRLVYVRVFNGAAAELAPYLAQARLHTVRVTVTRRTGKTIVKQIQLKDQPGKQEFHIAASDVIGVRFTIESAYGAGAGKLVALAEVEFLARA